jgi:hypothetical protein
MSRIGAPRLWGEGRGEVAVLSIYTDLYLKMIYDQ